MFARHTTVLACAALLAAAAGGCGRGPAAPAADDGGPRIVAYSPSLSALVFELGLGDRVVGVPRWARLPPGVRRPVVGDALTVDAEAIVAVRPTLILVQGARIPGFDAVRSLDPSIRIEPFEIESLDDVGRAALRICDLCGRPPAARARCAGFAGRLAALRARPAPPTRPRVLFVMGTDRPTAAGPGSFVADLIETCGGANAGADLPGATRWRATDLEAIARARPDVIVCQTEPGQAADAARAYWSRWPEIPAARAGRVFAVVEPEWTIPSMAILDRADALERMLFPGGRP